MMDFTMCNMKINIFPGFQLREWVIVLSMIFFLLCQSVDCSYNGRNLGYTTVPHALINDNEANIDLAFNSIQTLNDDEFATYTDLGILKMCCNGLYEIHQNAFRHTRIWFLQLNDNQLDEFPNITTISNTIVKLYLHDNYISNLNPDLLSPLIQLKVLRLYRNKITELLPKMFIDNGNLQELNLDSNNINEVAEDTFAGLSRLNALYLRQNNISILPLKLLEPLDSLTQLMVSYNPIKTWPDFSFAPLVYEVIFANGVEDYSPTPYQLPEEFCMVRAVTMSYLNHGADLPLFACQENETNINTLHLVSRKLNDTTDFSRIQSILTLRSLHIDDNSFTTFPNITYSIRQRLHGLMISDCKMQTIDPSVLEGYDDLRELDLSENQLVLVPTVLFNLTEDLRLNDMPSLDFNQSIWAEHMCEARNGKLRSLSLAGSMTSLQQFPDVSHILCNRATELKVILTEVTKLLLD